MVSSSQLIGAIAISLVLVLVCGAAIAWWKINRDHPKSTLPNQTAVAVLPFGNMGAETDVDFLRLALPDEIATTLSHVCSLSIRPFSESSKYISPDTDFQKAGREMRVSSIVTGHFLKAGDQLQVTLEAIDVDTNQAVWRETLSVACQNMIAMREQVLSRISSGLVPALRPAAGPDWAGWFVYPPSPVIAGSPVVWSLKATRSLGRTAKKYVLGLNTLTPSWRSVGLKDSLQPKVSEPLKCVA
jgi:TolB-like protein